MADGKLNNQSSGKIEGPDEIGRDGLVYTPGLLKNLLVDFTLSFLMTNPRDMIDFGLSYFKNLRVKRYAMIEQSKCIGEDAGEEDGDDDSLLEWKQDKKSKDLARNQVHSELPHLRRKSVFGDTTSYTSISEEEWTPAVYPKTDEQRRNCHERMKEVMLFRDINPEDVAVLVDAMYYKEVKPGEKIIVQGEDGDYFYIIDAGLYEAYYASSEGVKGIAKYNNHGSFGELALMYNVPRTCSIKALTRGGLWALDRMTFKRVVVKSAKRKRTRYMNFLHKVPLLKNLAEYEMLNLADSFVRKTAKQGDCIIKQGDEADGMYFIEEGQVGVSMMDPNGKEIGLQELNVGDYFGELALIEKQPRAATAYAMNDVKLAFLCSEAFERLLGPCRNFMERKLSEYKRDYEKMSLRLRSGTVDMDRDKIKRQNEKMLSTGSVPALKWQGGTVRISTQDIERRRSNASGGTTEVRDESLKRHSARQSSGKIHRASRFDDRKPSIFKILPEVMQSAIAFDDVNKSVRQ